LQWTLTTLGGGPPVFEHVTILLSFVYAIALTHLLSSTTELVLARKRVRFSGLYALWVFIALLMLLINWMSFWGLTGLRHWTVVEVVIQFASAIVQYFTCSTLRVTEGRDEAVDLPDLYKERRPVFFGALLALCLISAFQNWWDRDNYAGFAPGEWIGEDLTIVAGSILVVSAGWARPRWLQWTAALAFLGLCVFWLSAYTMPVG
jgi:hypothetical protein